MSSGKKKRSKPFSSKKKKRSKPFSPRLRTTIVLILCGIFLLLSFNPSMFTGGDNAQYITLAKSILQGKYRNLAFIGTPAEVEIPPGYPLLIAPLIALFPNTYIPTKLLSFAFMLLAIYLSLKIFDRYGIPMLAGAIFCIVMSINQTISEFSHWTLTETPFMAISLLGVWLFEKYHDSKKIGEFILASAIMTLSVYIRPVGIPLILGASAFLLLKKRFKRVGILLATSIVVYGPWLVRNILVRTGNEESFYLVNFFQKNVNGNAEAIGIGGVFDRIGQNAVRYFFSPLPTTRRVVSSNIKVLYTVSVLIILIIAVVGLIKMLKKSFIPYYMVFYMGMLLVYNPTYATFRYLLPMVPLLFILLWEGLNIKRPFDAAKRRRPALIAIASIMLISSVVAYAPVMGEDIEVLSDYSHGNKDAGLPHPAWGRFIEACKWIKTNTPKDAALITRKPRLSYILSDRPGKVYFFSSNPAEVMADIDSSGADYVILDRIMQSTAAYLVPTVQTYPQRFSVVYKTEPPETYVLRIVPKENAHRTERKSDE